MRQAGDLILKEDKLKLTPSGTGQFCGAASPCYHALQAQASGEGLRGCWAAHRVQGGACGVSSQPPLHSHRASWVEAGGAGERSPLSLLFVAPQEHCCRGKKLFTGQKPESTPVSEGQRRQARGCPALFLAVPNTSMLAQDGPHRDTVLKPSPNLEKITHM